MGTSSVPPGWMTKANGKIMKSSSKSMGLETIIIRDITQTQKDKHCLFTLICKCQFLNFRYMCLIQNNHRGWVAGKETEGSRGSSKEGPIEDSVIKEIRGS